MTGSSTIDSLVISAPFIVVHGADPPGDLIKEFVTKERAWAATAKMNRGLQPKLSPGQCPELLHD